MSEIELWAKANKLPLNEEKTKLLMITGRRLASKLTEKPMINIGEKGHLKLLKMQPCWV